MTDEFAQNYKKIGLKVSYYRKLSGLTQKQFAAKLGVGTSFIGQIEAPNIDKTISMDTLFRLARELGVPASKLLDFE